jgi:hypothetical protein
MAKSKTISEKQLKQKREHGPSGSTCLANTSPSVQAPVPPLIIIIIV